VGCSMRTIETRVRLPVSAPEYWHMFHGQFAEFRADADDCVFKLLKREERTVDTAEGTVRREIHRVSRVVFNTNPVPAKLRHLLKEPVFSMETDAIWSPDRFDREHPQRFRTQIPALGKRVEITGEHWLEPLSETACTACYRSNISINITGLGRVLEKAVEGNITFSNDGLPEVILQWKALQKARESEGFAPDAPVDHELMRRTTLELRTGQAFVRRSLAVAAQEELRRISLAPPEEAEDVSSTDEKPVDPVQALATMAALISHGPGADEDAASDAGTSRHSAAPSPLPSLRRTALLAEGDFNDVPQEQQGDALHVHVPFLFSVIPQVLRRMSSNVRRVIDRLSDKTSTRTSRASSFASPPQSIHGAAGTRRRGTLPASHSPAGPHAHQRDGVIASHAQARGSDSRLGR